MWIKEKIEDAWWYVTDVYKSIRCWYRHNFNKKHWNVIKCAIKGYPFDYGYMNDLELAKLEEMLEYFKHSDIIVEDQKELIIKWISLAIEMLHIYMDDGKGYYKEGLCKSIPAERTKEFPFNWRLVSNIKKVNKRNARRFDANPCWNEWDIYQCKALYIYHKIKQYHSAEWWD